MAMAFRGKNRHYEWDKIHADHLRETGRRCGMDTPAIDSIIARLITNIPQAIELTSRSLPPDFPAAVADPIFAGMTKQLAVLASG